MGFPENGAIVGHLKDAVAHRFQFGIGGNDGAAGIGLDGESALRRFLNRLADSLQGEIGGVGIGVVIL